MSRRIGARVHEDHPLDADVFGANFGEDWVVPREGVAFLVVREAAGGALLSAYGAEGHLVADRFAPALGPLEEVLAELHRRGHCDAPREIPPGERRVLAFLRSSG